MRLSAGKKTMVRLRRKLVNLFVWSFRIRSHTDSSKKPDLLDFIIKFCPTDWDTKRLADEMNFIAFSTSVLVATVGSISIEMFLPS